MNILAVSPRVVFPPYRGSSVRTYNLLRHLSVRHEIRQFSYARPQERPRRHGGDTIAVTRSYREYRYFSPGASMLTEVGERLWVSAPVLTGVALGLTRPAILRAWLRWADVTLVEFPWQFAFCRRAHPFGRFVLAAHNVEAEKFASYAEAAGRPALSGAWVRFLTRVERHAVTKAEMVLAVSAEDRAALIRRYQVDPARVVVIPNGADTARYQPADRAARHTARAALGLPDKPVVLYVAADIPPNRAGLQWVRRVARRAARFTFLVVGTIAPPGAEGNVIAAGVVDDLGVYLRAADLAICPIAHGGGTKIKLLEALAAGLPTVAFREAVYGVAARHGVHLLVAEPSEEALASALDRLADDAELTGRLRASARRLICEQYDWRTIAQRLDQALAAFRPSAAARPNGGLPARPPASRGAGVAGTKPAS